VRVDDGLPLSSRNSRLSGDGRFAARALPRGLAKAAKAFLKGERTSVKLMEIVYEELLVYPGVEVDYADVVRVRGFEETSDAAVGDLLAVAVFVEGVRLIDHLLLGTDPLPVDLDPEE
jgi:pantothenate synthetase